MQSLVLAKVISSKLRQNFEQNKVFQHLTCLSDENCIDILIPILRKDPEQRTKQEIVFICKIFQNQQLLDDIEQQLGQIGLSQSMKYLHYQFYSNQTVVYSPENKIDANLILLQGKVVILTNSNLGQLKRQQSQILIQNLSQSESNYLHTKFPQTSILKILTQGDQFGCFASDQSIKFKSNIAVCLEDSHIALLQKKHLTKVQLHIQHIMRQEEIQFMRTFSIFERFFNGEIESIMKSASTLTNQPPNYVIYKRNDTAQKLYFIKEGEVQLTLPQDENQPEKDLQEKNLKLLEVDLPKKDIDTNQIQNSHHYLQINNYLQLRKQYQAKKKEIAIAIIGPNQMFGEEAFLKINRQYEAKIHSTTSKIYEIDACAFESIVTRKYDNLNQFIEYYKSEIFDKKQEKRQASLTKIKNILEKFQLINNSSQQYKSNFQKDNNSVQYCKSSKPNTPLRQNVKSNNIISVDFNNKQMQEKRPLTMQHPKREKQVTNSQQIDNIFSTENPQNYCTPVKNRMYTQQQQSNNSGSNWVSQQKKKQQLMNLTQPPNQLFKQMDVQYQSEIKNIFGENIKQRAKSSYNQRKLSMNSKNFVKMTHSIDNIQQLVSNSKNLQNYQLNNNSFNTNLCKCDTPLINLKELMIQDKYIKSLDFKKKERLVLDNNSFNKKLQQQQQLQMNSPNNINNNTSNNNSHIFQQQLQDQKLNDLRLQQQFTTTYTSTNQHNNNNTENENQEMLPYQYSIFKPKKQAFINAIRFYKNQEQAQNLKNNQLIKKLTQQKNKKLQINNHSQLRSNGQLIDRVADFMIDSTFNNSTSEKTSKKIKTQCMQINNLISTYTVNGRCQTSHN